jgi:hypothetical protein
VNRTFRYLATLCGVALVGWGVPYPGNALSLTVPSCLDTENVEYSNPYVTDEGYVIADKVTYRGGNQSGSIISWGEVYADCTHRNMIVVKNNGKEAFAEAALFDNAVKAEEAYTFRAIAGIMRDNGFDAQFAKIRRYSCLCEDGFTAEPSY